MPRRARIEDCVAKCNRTGESDAETRLLPAHDIAHHADHTQGHFKRAARDADPHPDDMPDWICCRDHVADAEADERAAEKPANVIDHVREGAEIEDGSERVRNEDE